MDANAPGWQVLYNLPEATRICGILLTPFLPDSPRQALAPIGAGEDCRSWRIPLPSGAAVPPPPR